ncbi:hypothetical protein [Streptomyces sp. NPDC006645]|uniref:hypothetical protein n=1 Tax=unclassified Streptomyces TaxID=2593676 RepID=UPI0033AACF3C
MNNTDQPDEQGNQQGDEPTVAHYTRADASNFPTSLAGQQAAVEGMLANTGWKQADQEEQGTVWTPGRIRRAMKGPLEPTPAGRRLAAQMLAMINKWEQERRAEIIAAGGDPDEDRDPFEYVRAIADEWADTANDAARRAALLDRLAIDLDTSEVGALRLAAEAAAAVTPRLIYADADDGVAVAATAEDLGVSETYVYRILRQRPAADQ